MCRYMYIFTDCTVAEFRIHSLCFELDGAFAMEVYELYGLGAVVDYGALED